MIKLSEIEFEEEIKDYGLEIRARLVLQTKVCIPKTNLLKMPVDVYKDNLTQEIIEKLYGELKEDMYYLLEVSNFSPNVSTLKLNEIYERFKAVTG